MIAGVGAGVATGTEATEPKTSSDDSDRKRKGDRLPIHMYIIMHCPKRSTMLEGVATIQWDPPVYTFNVLFYIKRR